MKCEYTYLAADNVLEAIDDVNKLARSGWRVIQVIQREENHRPDGECLSEEIIFFLERAAS